MNYNNEHLSQLKDEVETLYNYLKNTSVNICVIQALTKSAYDLSLNLKNTDKKEILNFVNEPIEDLDFSCRTYHCLKRAGIDDLNKLVSYTPERLMTLKNLGKMCIKEIRYRLEEKGLHLAD